MVVDGTTVWLVDILPGVKVTGVVGVDGGL